MKGIIIYGSPEGAITFCEFVNEASYELKNYYGSQEFASCLKGEASKVSKAKCSKDDTYDFETGALIALMKMCGKEKALKAVEELYFLKEPRGADLDGDILESKVEHMAKKNAELLGENSRLNYIKSCNESTIESLENTRDLLINKNNELIEENEKLKSDKDKSWKNYQRNIQKKQDRINELQAQIKASEDDKQKNIEYYEKEIKNLNYRLTCKDISLEAKDKKTSIYEKRMLALEAENEKLKTDCEKLQHGYNDMMFCGGRQNGKQFTFLVDLFKKLDKKKVQEVYKKAYGDRVIWCTSQPEIHPLSTAIMESAIYLGKRPVYTSIDEWAYKPVSKREQMWDEILKEGRTPVYVKREDILDFLKECERTGIKWSSGESPLETKPLLMSEGYDGVYFFVMTSLDISKTLSTAKRGIKEFRHVMTWWCMACPEEAQAAIHYIPPMRWDLFNQGRLAVKVNYNNYKEFYEACEKEFGKRPITAVFTGDFTVSICKKDGLFEIFTIEDQKKSGKKIVDWEDVR